MQHDIRQALETALGELDRERAAFVEGLQNSAAALHRAARLLDEGRREEAVSALSECCSLEYDLLGDTEAASGFAEAVGLSEELGDFEERSLDIPATCLACGLDRDSGDCKCEHHESA